METENTHYISLGENCLTDNILERFNIKSFTTPYSHCRSNIDYAIHLESEEYKNLLSTDLLSYDYVGKTKVVRNNYYSKSDNIYNIMHVKGFEFTHHDIINNKNHRESFERKISRMISLDSQKNLKFFYHYRNNSHLNIQVFISKAIKFLSFYEKRNIKCELIFFTQEIISNKEDRAVIKSYNSDTVKGYTFKTLEVWGGDDPDVLWAKKDNDLISTMIEDNK